MGKSGQSFNKVLGKKIKAKGLQKLRWFCQVCEKQCRDENGFKCHLNSDSHQRAMVTFSHHAGKMLSQFSREFEGAFLDIAKRRARSQFIAANLIYNELISDRFHTHMNSTVWVTLSNFVQHLAQTGKCLVEERPKGWFIMYVEKDPDLVRRQEALLKTRKHELDEEARNMEFIKEQVAKAHALEASSNNGGVNTETQGNSNPAVANTLDLSALDSNAFSFSLKPGAKRGFATLTQPAKIEQTTAVAVPSPAAAVAPAGAPEEADNGEGEPNPEEEEEEGDGMYVDEFGRLRSLADDAEAEEEEDEEQGDEKGKQTEAPASADPQSDVSKVAVAATAAATTTTPAAALPPHAPTQPAATSTAPAASQSAGSAPQSAVAPPPPDARPTELLPSVKPGEPKRKLTAVEEIKLIEEQKKEKMKRRDYWLDEGIVVKVINKQLADGKYYKKKGVVEQVIDRYVGLISMLDPDVKGHKLKLDQSQLETVIPAIGGKMKIVNGAYRGEQVTLMAVDMDNFCIQVKIDHGLQHGRVLDRIAYEDACKLHV